ncbi:TraK domain-containing protein [Sutterella megalosphaeroides]|uniref:TraK C-terminal domain-containing protein n=1 Tax=Sutterella megalosphaeroides TaxID=2494234 RepID=A0A2Z6IAR4_9BURK|nr:type-F conjugative transfer system secretin TraK [Sutterella megalosphaeroides]BBF23474.1 hypothetical protein SUTMEG_13650 [Sutterella megalosphaeroides]
MTDRTRRTLFSAFDHALPRAKRSALCSFFPFAAFLTAGTAAGTGAALLFGLLHPAECEARTTDAPAQPEYHSILPFLDGYAYTGDPDGVPEEESVSTKPSTVEPAKTEPRKADSHAANAALRNEAPVAPEGRAVPDALHSGEAPEAPEHREASRPMEDGEDGEDAKEAPAKALAEELADTHAKHANEPDTAPSQTSNASSNSASDAAIDEAPQAIRTTEATEANDVNEAAGALTPARTVEPAFRAAPRAQNPFVRQRETVPSLVFHISPYQTSRLAVEGERIASAIWDQADLTLEAESRTGEVYLLPKRLGRMQLYVTTESGETAGITIVADERAEPENIVLERRRSRNATEQAEHRTAPTRQLPALPASDFEGALKTFAATLARGEEPPAVEKRPCVETEAVLHARKVLATLAPKAEVCYAARGLFATRIRIKNRSIRPVLVRESALLAPQVLAVTAEKPVLAAGESTVFHIIEATHD